MNFALQVAAFIFIELVTFPLGCGVVLDLCSLKLFAEADLQSRIAFCYQAPLTAVFYHWVAGTMFMSVSTFYVVFCGSSFNVPGTPLLYYCQAVGASCDQEPCGLSKILKTRMHILFVTFSIARHSLNSARSVSVGLCTLSWLLA